MKLSQALPGADPASKKKEVSVELVKTMKKEEMRGHKDSSE